MHAKQPRSTVTVSRTSPPSRTRTQRLWGSRHTGRVSCTRQLRDPLVLTGVALAMSLLGLVARWILVRRALSIDPAILLRGERSEERRVGKECRGGWSR